MTSIFIFIVVLMNMKATLIIVCSLACVGADAFSSAPSSQELLRRPNDFSRFLAIPMLMVSLSVQPATAMTNDGGTSSYKLSDSAAFKLLPREMRKSTAIQQLQDLKELQDARLDKCADRGIYWEQCFFMGQSEGVDAIGKVVFGIGDSQSGIDSQFISPVGALNPPPEMKKSIPTW
jgi:hypothetical protein